jgi:hypothetical protein
MLRDAVVSDMPSIAATAEQSRNAVDALERCARLLPHAVRITQRLCS